MKTPKSLIPLAASAALSPLAFAGNMDVRLDLEQTGAPINPFIYGQFIEHLGRCIYGGIWAEMLEDRKFFFPITDEYDPYKSLQDTAFPVVGASPWEIIGNPEGVQMIKEDSFVGEHTPEIRAGSGIRQHDLAIVSGKSYVGYIWLRNHDMDGSDVIVSLSAGIGVPHVMDSVARLTGDEYSKFTFKFTSTVSTDKATLSVEVTKGAALVGTLSLMPADNIQGMRPDTLALLKELNSPIYRWPGGNFVSGYNWRDGIGDRDRRPPRKNPAWTGVEHNDFGTDEFIAFCRLVGTEPAIAANTGFGDAYSAAQWVEYCNSGADTVGGGWRIQNGNKEPYDVKYWCIGNEMWGNWQLGFMQLHQYVLKHNEVVDAMRAVDPEIQPIGVGAVNHLNPANDPVATKAGRAWSTGMLEDCGDHMSYLSEHFYDGRIPWGNGEGIPTIQHVKLMKNNIRRIATAHRELQPTIKQLGGRIVPIAMDEWNYWHNVYEYGELGCVYDLKDGLGIVVGLHEYYRQSDLIQIANYAQTVNVIGCIKTTKTEAEFESTGIALKLYRAKWQPIPLLLPDQYGDCDIAASVSEDRKVLTVSVVNPTSEAVVAALAVAGVSLPATATTWTLSGPAHDAFNSPGKPRVVDAVEAASVDISKGLSVPALSSVLFRIAL